MAGAPHFERPRREEYTRLARRDLHAARRELLGVPGEPRDAADVLLLLGEDERDAHAAAPRATGSADAMEVAGVLGRRVEVDDVRDVDEVEPARGDVRRDERRRLPALEAP